MRASGFWLTLIRLFGAGLLLATPVAAQIQVQSGFQLPPLGADTTCVDYLFLPGDTLIYTVESADSVAMLGDPILLKVRNEVVSVICDSVSQGLFHLRITLRSYIEQQRTATDSVVRTTTPWLKRDAYVSIDAHGRRASVRADSDTKAAITPGGAFQPLLIPPFHDSCGVQNQSWLVVDTTLLVENGVPEPVFVHSTLWRMLGAVDTLDRRFVQIEYTQTALGKVVTRSNSVNVDMQAVIAAYGKVSMDHELRVPYHVFATSEDKIEITTPGGSIKKGKHHLSMHAQLREIRSPHQERQWRLSR